MSSRRSKLNIQLEVLKAVREGVDKPTRIMYAANMSWNPVRKILDSLVDGGLLSVISNTVGKRTKRRFEITEKGVSVLNYFEGAKELVDII
jgi:predicted transcriptional regulator